MGELVVPQKSAESAMGLVAALVMLDIVSLDEMMLLMIEMEALVAAA